MNATLTRSQWSKMLLIVEVVLAVSIPLISMGLWSETGVYLVWVAAVLLAPIHIARRKVMGAYCGHRFMMVRDFLVAAFAICLAIYFNVFR